MPSLTQFPSKTNKWHVPVDPQQRLQRWINKRATPPSHITVRPLLLRMPQQVQNDNEFDTDLVWLTACGELRLGSISGPIIGTIAK